MSEQLTDLGDLAGFDLADPAVKADPWPVYDRIRATHPLLPLPEPGLYLLTRFEDCLQVLRDPRWSSNPVHRVHPEGVEMDVRTTISQGGNSTVLLFIDPPDHTRLRGLVNKAFTPRAVERWRPRIEQIVEDTLDAAEAKGEFDVIADVGFPIPITVICEMLGVPADDREKFGPWSSAATRLLDGVLEPELMQQSLLGAMMIINELNGIIEDHRTNPRDDLLSALIAAEEEGDKLTEEELRSITLLLFVAGHETTTNLIGNGTNNLLRQRDQWERLVADPSLVGSAVEELLRYEGPVHLTGRIAREDGLEVGGRTFAKGESVVTLVAAANRDPDRFDDPARLDIGRNDSHHLAFSYGIHYCLGAALARLEGQITLAALARRFPDLRPLDDTVEYRDHFVLRGLKELRVAVR